MNAFTKCSALVFLLSSVAWAQLPSSTLLSGACGPNDTTFTVRERSGRSSPHSQPPQSKARIVVFIEAISIVTGCYEAARVGVDGKWVGAACDGTYISMDVDPGEHRLCASFPQKKNTKYIALYEFTAEPGKQYYFRAEIIDSNQYGANRGIHLDPINREEGLLLSSIRPASESTVK